MQKMKPQASPASRRSPYSSYFLVIVFVFFVVILYGEDFTCILRRPFANAPRMQELVPAPKGKGGELEPFALGESRSECNIFEGEWIFDEKTRPLYEEDECPYIQPQLTCREHGRPDTGYRHWRWQPHGCNLPRFNATLMLEMLRGKRLLFAGDSLNRGQFVSLVCLLHRVIPHDAKSMETFGSLTVFKAKDYNASVEFYWAPFLVESNSDDAVVHRITDRIVRVGSINKHARHWKGADILVLNTYLWWMAGSQIKTLRGSFDSATKNITMMPVEDAYKLALRRMLKWAEKNMDPRKTRLLFVSMSPSHDRSKDWGGEPDGNCYNETTPIKDPNYWGSTTNKNIMRAATQVFSTTRVPVNFLNITQLSEYRKDAHTQIYKKQWNPLTPEKLANPKSYSDCIHWCLPGLQDTWNELLYTKLFFP